MNEMLRSYKIKSFTNIVVLAPPCTGKTYFIEKENFINTDKASLFTTARIIDGDKIVKWVKDDKGWNTYQVAEQILNYMSEGDNLIFINLPTEIGHLKDGGARVRIVLPDDVDTCLKRLKDRGGEYNLSEDEVVGSIQAYLDHISKEEEVIRINFKEAVEEFYDLVTLDGQIAKSPENPGKTIMNEIATSVKFSSLSDYVDIKAKRLALEIKLGEIQLRNLTVSEYNRYIGTVRREIIRRLKGAVGKGADESHRSAINTLMIILVRDLRSKYGTVDEEFFNLRLKDVYYNAEHTGGMIHDNVSHHVELYIKENNIDTINWRRNSSD